MNEIIKKEVKVPKNTIVGYFILAISKLKNELRSEGYHGPYKVVSSIDVESHAQSGVHFYENVGVTEFKRVEERRDIIEWVIDRDLDEDILQLRTISDQELETYYNFQIWAIIKQVRRELDQITEILIKRNKIKV